MSGLLMLAPHAMAVGGGGVLVNNLLSPDPREVWVAPAADEVRLDIDLGVATAIDTVYLGYAVLSQPASLSLSVEGGPAVQRGFALPRLAGRPAHGLVALDAPVIGRFLSVTIDLAAADQPLRAGVAMAGLSFRPAWPQEWGGGRPVVDCGTRDRLAGGGFAIDRGVRKGGWQWTLGDLSDDELATLYALALDRGETSPLLVVEDSDPVRPGLCERIHYGVFDKLQAYERRDSGLTRWALTFEDWL